MKRLSIGKWLPILLLLAMASISFSAKPAANTHRKKSRDMLYYWYDTNDNYVEWETLDYEINVLEDEYGVWVDQNSIGGTLLEKGYQVPGKPHMGVVQAFLYGHF